MARRIFVALPISEPLQKEIFAWEKNFSNLPVRWLLGKNLHITMIPPWYEDDVDEVLNKLTSVHGEVMDLEFKTITFGSNPRAPRLIWAEGKTPPQLLELKSRLEEVLEIKPESRPFRLHLTLARFPEESFSQFPVKILQEEVVWSEKINSFVLMESHLSRRGADYEILDTFELK